MDYNDILLVGITGVLLFLVWRKVNSVLYSDFLSPFNLLFWSWVVPLLLRGLHISPLERDWSAEAVAGIALVTLSLTGVSLLPALRRTRIRSFPMSAASFREIGHQLNYRSCTVLLLALFLADFSLYIYTEFILNPGGFSLVNALLGNISLEGARLYNWWKDESRPGFASLVLILTSFLNLLCATFYLKFRFAKGLPKKLFFLFIAMQSLAFGLIKLSKTDATIAFVALAAAEWYYQKFCEQISRQGRLRGMLYWSVAGVLAVGLVFVMFYSTAAYRVGEAEDDVRVFEWLLVENDKPTILTVLLYYIYAYTTLNFENAARFITSYDGGFNLGISALRPFLSLVMQGRIADEMLSKIDFNTVTTGLIAGTFISPVFAELKWIGLVIVPLVYAFLVNSVYWSFRKTPSLIHFLLYANFAFCWVFMFFSNAFATLSFYTNAVLIILLGAALNRLTKQKTNTKSDPQAGLIARQT